MASTKKHPASNGSDSQSPKKRARAAADAMAGLPATMNALVAYGPKDYRFVGNYPMPELGDEEVMVRVTCVGICASDGKMFAGADFYWGPGGRAKRGGVVTGHEFVGTVVALGAGAATKYAAEDGSPLQIGDQAVCEQMLVCHKCWFCNTKNYNKCDNLKIYGQALDGAMADYMVYKKGSFVYKAPPESVLPPHHAVFAEPLAVGVHAVDRADLPACAALLPAPGTGTVSEAAPCAHRLLVVVAGAGPMGLCVAASARRAFPDAYIVSLDRRPFKLDIAKKAGATEALLVEAGANYSNAHNRIKELAGRRGGADVYFEVTGNPEAVMQGIAMVRKKGKFVHVSIFKNGIVPSDWNALSAGKELQVVGASLGYGCWARALDMLKDGCLPMEDIITHRMPLASFKEAYALAMKPLNAVKVVLDPSLKATAGAGGKGAATTSVEASVASATPAASGGAGGGAGAGATPASAAASTAASTTGGVFELPGSVVWVTGSSRGIGRAIAQRLSEGGAKVVLHGTRETSPSTFGEGSTMAQLAAHVAKLTGNPTMSVVGDLTDEAVVTKLTAQITAKFGGIDALVCCAGGNIGTSGIQGAAGGKPATDDGIFVPVTDIRRVVDVNLMTAILSCKAVAPAMIERMRGRIIIIGSIAGCAGRSQGVMYAVSKAAVHEYARCLSVQLRPHGVSVNVVAPGGTVTHRFMANLGKDFAAEQASVDSGKSKLDRLGHVSDTANAVAMLLSRDAHFINGQVVRVDGGVQTFAC